MKLKDLEKKYGLDFGEAREMTVYQYLKKIGYPSLADMMKGGENMIKYRKINPIKTETYEVALDDHCLVVKVGEKILHLSEAMTKWITENRKHIDFEKQEWRGGET